MSLVGETVNLQFLVGGRPVGATNPLPIKGEVDAKLTGSRAGLTVLASQARPDNIVAYEAGDVVGQDPAANIEFTNVLSDAGGNFIVLGTRLRIDVGAIPPGMTGFRLHLYNAAPTAIIDGGVFDLPSGDRDKYLGYITITTPVDLGNTLIAQDDGINFTGKLADESTSMYGVLQTLGAFTPTAQCAKTITLNIVGV